MLYINDIPRIDYSREMYELAATVERKVAEIPVISDPRWRRTIRNAVLGRSVSATLNISGSGITPEKVRDIVAKKNVGEADDEVTEAVNTVRVYSDLRSYDVLSADEFKEAQSVLMAGLMDTKGYRNVSVGLYDGDVLVYKAPKGSDVSAMMDRLFHWCATTDLPKPIVAAVADYYIETIHPFFDGNGRMGRLWGSAILAAENKKFRDVSTEWQILGHKEEYFEALKKSQMDSNCTAYVMFMLARMSEALDDLAHMSEPRMAELLKNMTTYAMPAQRIMDKMDLHSRTNFLKNYMRPAVEYGFVTMSDPDNPRAREQRYTKRLF